MTSSARSVVATCALLFCLLGFVRAASAAEPLMDRTLPLREQALIERFAKTPRIRRPQVLSLSPDGSHLLYIVAQSTISEASELRLLTVRGQRTVALPALGSDIRPYQVDRFHVAAFQWSSDGQRIALLDERKLRLVIWDAHTPSQPSEISLPALKADLAGQEIDEWIWRSESNELLLGMVPVPPPSPSARYSTANEWMWAWSREMQVRTAAKHAAGQLAAGNRPLRLFRLRLTDQTLRDVTPSGVTLYGRPRGANDGSQWRLASDRRRVFFSVGDPLLGDEAKYGVSAFKLWLIRNHDPRAREFEHASNHVYEWNLMNDAVSAVYDGGPGRIAGIVPGGRTGEAAFLEEAVDLANWPADDRWARLRMQAGGQPPRSVGVEASLLDWPVFGSEDPDIVYQYQAGAQNRLLETHLSTGHQTVISPPSLAVTACSVSADGRTIAAVLESVSAPPAIFLWTRARASWRRVTEYAEAPDLGVGTMEYLTWRSRDDRFDIDGVLVKPQGFDPRKRYPLIVYARGGKLQGYGAHLNMFNPWLANGGIPASVYADAGYLVLLPNHRGIAEFSPAYSAAHVGHFGDHYDLDIDAGIDFLIRKGWVDANRIAIMGHSSGGSIAAYAISHTDRFKAAIIEDSPDMLTDLYTDANVGGDFDLLYGYEAFYRTIGPDSMQRARVDPRRIRTPLLLRYQNRTGMPAFTPGSQPMSVVPSDSANQAQASRLANELSANGVPVEVLVDHSGHSVNLSERYAVEYASRTLQWLDYFVFGTGPNPIPAMPSGIDYAQDVQKNRQWESVLQRAAGLSQ